MQSWSSSWEIWSFLSCSSHGRQNKLSSTMPFSLDVSQYPSTNCVNRDMALQRMRELDKVIKFKGRQRDREKLLHYLIREINFVAKQILRCGIAANTHTHTKKIKKIQKNTKQTNKQNPVYMLARKFYMMVILKVCEANRCMLILCRLCLRSPSFASFSWKLATALTKK